MAMKKSFGVIVIIALVLGCNNKSNIPDTSGIKLNLEVSRFENDLFAIDTNQVGAALYSLRQKYPSFTPVFISGVLGLPGNTAVVERDIRRFISVNRPIYEATEKKYSKINDVKKELENGFRFVKFYFPS